jgi:hypothetical protein
MRIARILFSFICVALISDTNATEIEKPLASWSETVMTIGRTWPLGEFNVFAQAAGIPEQKTSERDRLWYVVLKKDGVLRMYCVRTRALSKQIDIVLFMGTADDRWHRALRVINPDGLAADLDAGPNNLVVRFLSSWCVSAGRYSLARVQNPIAPHAATAYSAITFFQTNGAT